MFKKIAAAIVLLTLALLVTMCGGEAEPTTIRLLTHDSFDISEETLMAFEAETGHTVEIVKSGDGGQMVNQAILSRNNPLADVIFGIDNTFLSRALENGILEAYEAADVSALDPTLLLDPEKRALPVDYGDVCLNYDKAWLGERQIAPPTTLADLVDPAYAGFTVVQNPATSSPGLAFLLTTIAAYGEEGYLDYWRALVANDVLVENGWSEAYYGAFTLYGGSRPIVVSYASSPPAEVLSAEEPLDVAPTGTVASADTCFRQIEFVGVLANTPVADAARQLVDFMLDVRFQEDIPLHMFVFPANQRAALPDVFMAHAEIPAEPVLIAPDAIAAGRDGWIAAWTATVLR
jgi:thiamine transport system substrate-binding protein